MSYEGSMKGSGIYATDHTLEVECEKCGKSWEEDFVADDWGIIQADIKCQCGNEFTFNWDKYDEGEDPYAPDRLEDYD
jgi:hypothetical protein